MREDVQKFLFVGPEEEKEVFFKRSQAEGVIHFIDPSSHHRKDIPPDIHRLTSAIKILRGLPPGDQEENYEDLEADAIVGLILDLNSKKERLFEEMRVIGVEKSRIEMYGDFSFDDIAYIQEKGHCSIQFFCARPNLFLEEPEPENLLYITSEYGLDYYVAVNDVPVSYDRMIELKFDRPLSQLLKREKEAERELHSIEQRLKENVKYNEFLHHALIDKLNHYHLYNTQTYVQEALGGSLFAVEGWVPMNKVGLLNGITDETSIYYDQIAIEPEDAIPTCLENEGLSRLGEDLVNIYDTPSSTDKDPSLWVLFCFGLFFAFIIGDAGYGSVYLAIALFLRYKFPDLKGTGKRVLNLFTFLCVGCVIWGILITSFFGMQIGVDNPIRNLSLVQWLAEKKVGYDIEHHDKAHQDWVEQFPELASIRDPHIFVSFRPKGDVEEPTVILNSISDNIMFELALFIGVVHLILSLARYAGRNWHNIGWILFLVGAYLYFPYNLEVPSVLNYVGGIDLVQGGIIGLELMLIGIGAAWILAIVKYGWVGIFEITVLIQVFADTLSYLRLYALGLAGVIVASTINEIASRLPLIIGVLLIVVAHFINIILATMSGIIHGLRLNFLEWYHYSFEGGGKPFQPLKLLKKE